MKVEDFDALGGIDSAMERIVSTDYARFADLSIPSVAMDFQRAGADLSRTMNASALGLAESFRSIWEPTLALEDSFRSILEPSVVLKDSPRKFCEPAFALESSFREAFAPSIEAIERSMLNVGSAIAGLSEGPNAANLVFHPPTFDIGRFIVPLPDLSPLLEWWEANKDVRDGTTALGESGYGFSEQLWAASFHAAMANLAPNVRGAVVTNRLLRFTRSSELEDELMGHFAGHALLRQRRTVVERAMRAHRERDYIVSIPLLMAQIEGIIADSLLAKQLIVSKGHRLYDRDANGKIKLGGKSGVAPLEVKGLVGLIDSSKYRSHPILCGVAEEIANRLSKTRNGIMHGRTANYHGAKLSVQAVLVLLIVSGDLAAFLNGTIGTGATLPLPDQSAPAAAQPAP